MPIVELHGLDGVTSEAKARLTSALTNAVRFVTPAREDTITVTLQAHPSKAKTQGGQPAEPAPARPDPAETVRGFLAAMEARDLDAAQSVLAEDFEMVFPGTGPMTSLGGLVEWAKGRYQFVTKSHDAVDVCDAGGVAVVFVRGTLSGKWHDGTAFEGIRFIDRFEVLAGKIARQDVWNDIAEVRTS